MRPAAAVEADAITTEVIRHGLASAAEQMKRALVRTAFSPVIYEVLDFAVALFDREVRQLAEAPALPLFMGTLSFCVREAVAGVGGEDALEPGDVILYNLPYGSGSHQQDAAVVTPVFVEGELVGYAAIKGHWLDIGGKDPLSTDTVDVFQEGKIFPGVKLYSAGELVGDIYRIAIANSRVAKMVAGDINAEVVGVRTGVAAFARLVERRGLETFRVAVERMLDHGEAVVRDYFARIPDGRYVGHGELDSDGLSDDPVPFELAVEVDGSDVRVDFSGSPDALRGPFNTPFPMTVSASRVAVSMLTGVGGSVNDGHFRALEVVARPGSMFRPLPPSPCNLGHFGALQAIEVVYDALAGAMPDAVPASSGGDLCPIVWWGVRERTREPWADGSPHPVGQGAHRHGDGANALMHVSQAATRFSPAEVWETRNPWLVEKVELAADSGGPGRRRGGLGLDMHFTMLEDASATSIVERSKNAPWGLVGGGAGRPNGAAIRRRDGSRFHFGKATRLAVEKGTTLELSTGGGGGYGPAADRDPEAVRADLREGYVTDAHARSHYPHAFDD